jgi:hypothetical protein
MSEASSRQQSLQEKSRLVRALASRLRDADPSLAILSAFVDVQRVSASPAGTSVPSVPRPANLLYMPVCCHNFA